ncbi:hypothetical protein [Spirochaeta cellobiosiphila]|nr:hypothetical protein [Spirochaeta cellobiosiphila]
MAKVSEITMLRKQLDDLENGSDVSGLLKESMDRISEHQKIARNR